MELEEKVILRSVLLGACIALAQSAAAEAPGDANQFTLICRWDDTGEHETVQIFGHGSHLIEQGLGKNIVEHHSDQTISQEAWVLTEDRERRAKLGLPNPPIYWSFTVNRYTGRMDYTSIDYSDGSSSARLGNCRRAKEQLL
jgi:hypothetical protein